MRRVKEERLLHGRENVLDLLWRHAEGDGPEVDLVVLVDAGDDKEDAGALGAARPKPTQPEQK